MEAANVIKLLIRLMEINSTSGHEGAFADFVASLLRSTGWHVHEQVLNSERKNLYATRSSSSKPRLILNTHLDTVPPYIPPTEDEHNIYGRGSNDAKGQLAAMIVAANSLVKSNQSLADQIGLLFVVGEEVDHIGMKEANKLNLSPEFLIVGEPTENKFATIQKGAVKVHVKVKGKAGHSGYPNSGKSAVHLLLDVLEDIRKHDWPQSDVHGNTTYNIGFITGGHALNAWAESAQASIFFRVTTSESDVKNRLAQIVGNRAELDYSLGGNDPVLLSNTPFEAPKIEAAFNTDLSYFDKLHSLKGVFLFGAGSITNAHSAGEFIPKKDLESGVETYKKLIVALLE